MELFDIYLAQLGDLFRIGLLVALVVTASNTAATLNPWIPVALGLVFVAVIIPTAMAGDSPVPLATSVGVGIFSNATILAILLALREAYRRIAR